MSPCTIQTKHQHFLDFLCGRTQTVEVVIDIKDVDNELVGDYVNDRAYKIHFQKWLNGIWQAKDDTLASLAAQHNKE